MKGVESELFQNPSQRQGGLAKDGSSRDGETLYWEWTLMDLLMNIVKNSGGFAANLVILLTEIQWTGRDEGRENQKLHFRHAGFAVSTGHLRGM